MGNKKNRENQSEHYQEPDLFSIIQETSKNTGDILETEIIEAMQKDPNIIAELHKALSVIQKDKEDNIEYTRIRNFAWHRVP